MGEMGRFDIASLKRRLAERAGDWVPRHFPKGRRLGNEWRMANIGGDPPRKQGSCIVALSGPYAGYFKDHDTQEGGDPLDTLSEATGLKGRALLERAAQIVGVAAPESAPAQRPTKVLTERSTKDRSAAVAEILRDLRAAKGTLVETYLAARGLRLPGTPDLKFHPALMDYQTGVRRPAMAAIPRRADGRPTGGVHRTYLSEDGSGKAEIPKARLALGPLEGGAIRLHAMGPDGRLGIAEGIETALAATALHGVPCWAALSTSGLRNFQLPEGVTELTVFADAGKAGRAAAEVAAARAGVPTRIVMPRHGDDFNDDLLRGESAKLPEEGLFAAASALTRESGGQAIRDLLRRALAAGLDPLSERRLVETIRLSARVPLAAISETLKRLRREEAPPWCAEMILWENGEPKPILANVVTALRLAPEWRGVIGLNEFAQCLTLRRPPPWAAAGEVFETRKWEALDDLRTTEWLQQAGLHADISVVVQGVQAVAAEHPFHPVRDYLEAMHWDGHPRLDRWLTFYLGVEDSAYARAAGSRWMISAVARIFRPGCKADCALILEGEQGLKKSTALRILGEPWFTDEIADLGSKDASLQTMGVWIVELAELDSMTRGEVARIKAFMSRATDRFRPPYGRHLVESPRQCVFAGSVNDDEYLRDATGGRRFWPVRCRAIDTEALGHDRDQLWAEARVRFEAGEPWWLHEEDLLAAAGAQQLSRYQSDPWDEAIRDFIEHRNSVTVPELLREALHRDTRDWTQSDMNRIARSLRLLGWRRWKARVGKGEYRWEYRRGDSQVPAAPHAEGERE